MRLLLAVSISLVLCAPGSASVVVVKEPTKDPIRTGIFEVVGTLVDESGNPLSGWTVEALEVGSNGHMMLKIDENNRFKGDAGKAMTNGEGRFRMTIEKAYFYGEKIRFGLRTYFGESASMPEHGNPHRDIVNKDLGTLAIFVVDEKTKRLDLDLNFDGPIAIKTK